MKNFIGPTLLGATLVLTVGSGMLKMPENKPPPQEESSPLGGDPSATIGFPGGGDPSQNPQNQNGNNQNGNQNEDPNYDPNMPGGPPGDGTGTNREWRGYVATDPESLRSQLPPQAKHLAESFVAAGQQYNIDPRFLMAISRHETGNWTSNAFLNRNNAMGVSSSSGVVNQTSHHSSIMSMGASLAGAPGTAGYYNKATTVGQVGAIYAPVGAANDPRNLNGYWPSSVGKYYDSYANL